MPHYPKKKLNTIKYPDAPSGYINIGKWEPPFAPVKRGFGFIGVLAEDKASGKLQCHKCGKWYEQLCTHILKHGYESGNEYRKDFGLLVGTALKSRRIRLVHSKTCSESIKKGKMNDGNNFIKGEPTFKKGNKYASNRKGIKKAAESANKYGVCDLQIMTKIINLSKRLGKTPTLIDIKKEYGQSLLSVMFQRYGSYIKYCKQYLKKQPNWSTHNPKPNKLWKKELENKAIELNKKKISISDKKKGLIMQSRKITELYGGWKPFRKTIEKKYKIKLINYRK